MQTILLSITLSVLLSICLGKNPPNIFFIVADDLGWNDVGWHNPKMHTPNLDNLARNGVILDSSYVQPVCSPSRGSFMSGYYPYHTGLQHGVLYPYDAGALPGRFTTLPEKLKTLGYATHIVGKWHLGYCNWKYTPTYRGFDTFYGFFGGSQDYYTHTKHNGTTYDFRFNKEVYHPKKRKYSAKLFSDRVIDIINNAQPEYQPLYLYIAFQSVHGPLQVPKRYLKYYKDQKHEKRKIYMGMVSALDEAVGKITAAIVSKGLMDNSIIVFTTDNGGPICKGATNYPLRGHKGSLWEGGTRGVAFVYSPTYLKKSGYVNTEMIHAVDWFPTLLHVAGGKPDTSIDDMDGVNQWKTISENRKSARDGFVYNIDSTINRWAIRYKNYKLLYGEVNPPQFKEKDRFMLFDLEGDPNERKDISETHIDIVEDLKRRFAIYHDTEVPANFAINKILAKYNTKVLSPGWC